MFFQRARMTGRLSVVAATAVESMLRGLEALECIPDRIWTDPYAIGWISGFASGSAIIYARQAHLSYGAVVQSMKGNDFWMLSFQKIVPKDRLSEMLRRISDLAKSNDAEFWHGSNAATKTLYFGAGSTVDPGDADILSATRTANILTKEGLYSEANRSTITKVLIGILFYDRFLS
jgi:hypothetical protein